MSIKKLKILFLLFLSAYEEWKNTVYPYDLDDFFCCSGRDETSPCGCNGITINETYEI